ncbi:MAG: hypothetical protein KGL34_01135 [Gammaproteobacteria bacterium]|nr:hypothetical protein [Gammaproteobacteria bacterium]
MSAGSESGLGRKLAALRDPAAYPHPVVSIEAIETHYAWVFLAGDYAYKLKKPVRVERMDHRRLEARLHSCRDEVRLNRRLAPDVYLGVMPLACGADGSLRVGGEGAPVEWLVRMRRLPRERALDRAVAAHAVTPAIAIGIGTLLGEFYGSAAPVPITGDALRQRLLAQVEADCLELRSADLAIPRELLERVIEAQRRYLREHGAQLERRAADGRFVEAHGDLRPEHVFIGSPPCVIDCLEFDRELRLLDPAEEIEYLSLELDLIDAGWVGEIVSARCHEMIGDAPPAALAAFYRGRRGMHRAVLVARHRLDPLYRDAGDWRAGAIRYLHRVAG